LSIKQDTEWRQVKNHY